MYFDTRVRLLLIPLPNFVPVVFICVLGLGLGASQLGHALCDPEGSGAAAPLRRLHGAGSCSVLPSRTFHVYVPVPSTPKCAWSKLTCATKKRISDTSVEVVERARVHPCYCTS